MTSPRRLAHFRVVGSALVIALLLGACAAETTTTSTGPVATSHPDEPPPTTPTPTLAPTPTFTPPPPRTSESGMTLDVGVVEPALGHRASVITLTNDGDHTIELDGYPEVRALDDAGAPIDVTVEHDSSYMAIDPGPAKVSVAPGEQVLSVVSWSATVTDPDRVERGAYLVVTAAPGEPAQTFPLDVDLGSTGRLSLTAWAAELVN